MKVKDLIARLEQFNPEAEVVLCEQPNYPMEHSLSRVTSREDTLDDPEDPTWVGRDGEKKDDVLLCEGSHLRYGNRDAWG